MVAWGRILLLALALASGAVLVACGSDESIPEEDAGTLLQRLDEVEQGMEAGNCEGARESAELLQAQVGEGELSRVPSDLDPEVRELLEDGATRLVQLVAEECVQAEDEAPEEIEVEPEAEPVEPEEPEEPEEIEPEEPAEEEGPPETAPGQRGGSGDDRGSSGGGSSGGGQGGGGGRSDPPSGGIAE